MKNELHHIFYIDDDMDILSVVKFALEKIGGYEVTATTDSRSAIEQLRTLTPDLIMLDIMMPEMDGPTVLAQLRTYPHLSDVPMVLTTALVQDADMERYKVLNVAGILHKPFNTMALPETIRSFWHNHHYQHVADEATIPEDLRREYLKTLGMYHNQISTFLMQCQQNNASRTEIENMAQLAHKLAGSGATYGYPQISDTARALKNSIHLEHDAEKIIPATKLFLDSLSQAVYNQ